MCSKTKGSMFHTVAFRVTLWYTVLFGVLSFGVFLSVYVALTSSFSQRVDDELLSEATEFEAFYREHGIEALGAEFQREAASGGVSRIFFRLLSPQGKVLASSDASAWGGLKTMPVYSVSQRDRVAVFETIRVRGQPGKARLLFKRTADGHTIQLGTTLQENEILMKKYREVFGVAVAVMLLCGCVGGWTVARRAMSAVERVTQTAVRIGGGDLSWRVPLGNEGREVDDLAVAFNNMLERIEALVKELKDVTNSVAHDLRSPITRIRGIAEATLSREDHLDAFREMAGAVVEESDRLVEMINTMLEIAQADAGVAEFSKEPVDVRRIIQDAVGLFLPMAEDKGVSLGADLPGEQLVVNGDRRRLQRLVANLVDNAIKYTGAGGTVLVSARAPASQVIIHVADSGIGISETDLPHIFARFYRGDTSRSTPGNGLGLSLARAIAQAHNGNISVASSQGGGSKFTVLLPCVLLCP